MLILVVGCASGVTPTPQAAKVRITSNAEVVKQCKFMGNVTAKATGGTWATTPGERAQLRMQQETLDLGGDTVLIAATAADARVAHTTGEAYKCQ
jgi:hypothetical protein